MKHLPNLLVVDDNPENLFFLSAIVKNLKVNLIQALSGSEALRKTKGIDLALAIIDVRMPGMNGYELVVKMNEERSAFKVPIIFLTASNSSEIQIFQGYHLGAVDYLFKPIEKQILLSKIAVFLDLYNQKQIIIRDAVLLKKSADELTRVNATLQKSEEKYRSYIENAPDGVFVADEKGKYIEVNEAACRITGYSKEELLEMAIPDLLPEESLKDGLAEFRKVTKTGTSKSDLKFKHKDGTKRWWVLQALKLSDTRFLCFAKDVTQRKEMEEALRTQQIELEMQNNELNSSKEQAEVAAQKYSNLYDFAPAGYFTLSNEKEILELNHNGAFMLGKKRSQLIGSHFGFFISTNTLSVFNAFFQNIFKSKVKQVSEVVLETANHQPKYVHIEGIIISNSNQCLLNVVDITGYKLVEQKLENNLKALNDTGRMAKVGGWKVDIATGKQTWTDETFRILEIDINKGEPLVPEGINFYVPASRPIIDQAVQRAIQYGEPYDLQLEIITAKGNHRWVHTVGKMNQINGETKSISGAIQDITERKHIELISIISEEKYKTILNSSPDGVFLINLKGVITEVSEIGIELLSVDNRFELVGKHIFQFVPNDEKNTVRKIIEKTMNEGLAQNIELKIKKKNHPLIFGEISSTLIQDRDGIPLSFMIIIRDITQRKKIESKQIHADRMASLGQMAAGIAHEINQPLNIISLVLDKILFESNKTETIDFELFKNKTGKIFENIIRIRNIIDHVRTFSRSHDDYILTAFDINTSIENAASMNMEQFKHLGIMLDLQLEKHMPTIIGNTYQFEQVIINLLTNAKDAVMEKKSKQENFIEMIVGIKSYQENQFLIVEVSDNGIGISKDDINNIMLPFYTTKEEGKGTGLGLSICYQIIKEMDGTIDITNEGLYGTKVKITLNTQK